MSALHRLEALGLALPPAAKPVGTYAPAVAAGSLAYTSGQLPVDDGQLIAIGKVPSAVSIDQAAQAARCATLNALSALADLTGSLDRVDRVIRLTVYVNSDQEFHDQAKVANGASELLRDLFGQDRLPTRCAIGAAELPLNAPVEVDLIAQILP